MFYRPEEGHGLPHNPFNAIVTPRPIGWISTRDAQGHDNLAPYYRRFGCTRLDGVELPPPTNPERVLGLELRPGAWNGVIGKVMRAA